MHGHCIDTYDIYYENRIIKLETDDEKELTKYMMNLKK